MNETLQLILSKYENVHSNYNAILLEEKKLLKDIDDTSKSLLILNETNDLSSYVSTYFSEKYVIEAKIKIDKLLSYIFFDKKLEVEIEFVELRNQKEVYFNLIEYLKDEKNEDAVIKTSDSDIGSGVKGVISLGFQIFVIEKFKKGRYLFLDESFTELNSKYFDRLMYIIRELINEMGLNILMSTNDDRIINSNYFDKNLYIEDGVLG